MLVDVMAAPAQTQPSPQAPATHEHPPAPPPAPLPALTCTYTGDQPAPDWCISSPSRPSILGTEGPQMSMSSRPTCSAEGGRQAGKQAHRYAGSGW